MDHIELQLIKENTIGLSKEDRYNYQSELDTRKRQDGIGICLALLLGWAGAHKFYLKDNTKGIIYAIGGTIGWLLLIPGIIIAVLCIVDAIGMQSEVKKFNRKLARDIRQEIDAMNEIETLD